MQDKRRHKRFTVNVLEVNGNMMFATEVKVIDISIGGISLKANRRLNIGSDYALKLDGKNRVIALKGAVVWSSLRESKAGPDGNQVSHESPPVISQELIDKIEHLYKWHKTMGYYKALCVKEWATDEHIKHAFQEMAQQFDPDKYPCPRESSQTKDPVKEKRIIPDRMAESLARILVEKGLITKEELNEKLREKKFGDCDER